MAIGSLKERTAIDVLTILLIMNNMVRSEFDGDIIRPEFPLPSDLDDNLGLPRGTMNRWYRKGHIEHNPDDPEFTENVEILINGLIQRGHSLRLIPELENALAKQSPDGPGTAIELLERLLIASGSGNISETSIAIDNILGVKQGTLYGIFAAARRGVPVPDPTGIITLPAISRLLTSLEPPPASDPRTEIIAQKLVDILATDRKAVFDAIATTINTSTKEIAGALKIEHHNLSRFIQNGGYPSSWRRIMSYLDTQPISPIVLETFKRMARAPDREETTPGNMLFNIHNYLFYSQTEFAGLIGMTQSHLTDLETGKDQLKEATWLEKIRPILLGLGTPRSMLTTMEELIMPPTTTPGTPGEQLDIIRISLHLSNKQLATVLDRMPNHTREILRGNIQPYYETWQGIIHRLEELQPPPEPDLIISLKTLVEQQARRERYITHEMLPEGTELTAGQMFRQIREEVLQTNQEAIAALVSVRLGSNVPSTSIGLLERGERPSTKIWGAILDILPQFGIDEDTITQLRETSEREHEAKAQTRPPDRGTSSMGDRQQSGPIVTPQADNPDQGTDGPQGNGQPRPSRPLPPRN